MVVHRIHGHHAATARDTIGCWAISAAPNQRAVLNRRVYRGAFQRGLEVQRVPRNRIQLHQLAIEVRGRVPGVADPDPVALQERPASSDHQGLVARPHIVGKRGLRSACPGRIDEARVTAQGTIVQRDFGVRPLPANAYGLGDWKGERGLVCSEGDSPVRENNCASADFSKGVDGILDASLVQSALGSGQQALGFVAAFCVLASSYEWTFFTPVGLIQSTSLFGRGCTGLSFMEVIPRRVLRNRRIPPHPPAPAGR